MEKVLQSDLLAEFGFLQEKEKEWGGVKWSCRGEGRITCWVLNNSCSESAFLPATGKA